MRTYIYIYMYVCMYIYIYICVCVCSLLPVADFITEHKPWSQLQALVLDIVDAPSTPGIWG